MTFDQKNQKITKYRRHSFFNIGTLLFGIIFIYLIVCIFLYLTETHVTPYEVVRGTISGNYRYQALSLRTEETVQTTQSGSIKYYAREGSKVSSGSTVCAINESGSTISVSYDDFSPDSKDVERLRNTLSGFSINYSDQNFQKTYDIRASIEGLLSEMTRELDDDYVSIRNRCTAPDSGFVIYGTDGFETTSPAELTTEMFDQNSYKFENLRGKEKVNAGDTIYKLITAEEWKLYFPMDRELVTELNGQTSITFRFLKDNQTFSAPFTIIQNGSGFFGEISLDNSLVRYATDRFLEIELVMNKKTGLKIPTSSIVEKEFYQIPEEYAIVNPDSEKEITLKVEEFRSDGSSEVSYVLANVYSHDEKNGYYLINKNLLTEDSCILKENTAKRKKISENDVKKLYGVYNINKGYAVFREITVIDQNEEYCIVESNNTYGLAAYDYIVKNASEVDVDQIIN
ncbi:MAG: HlyD family efflux transporter periplasmic adaptor subunit [Lachnospiraceae bacterium]|nr:HlyD family efflux transporter periplasmic adaptor subunit [Lachnospiraceae bacterium]